MIERRSQTLIQNCFVQIKDFSSPLCSRVFGRVRELLNGKAVVDLPDRVGLRDKSIEVDVERLRPTSQKKVPLLQLRGLGLTFEQIATQ